MKLRSAMAFSAICFTGLWHFYRPSNTWLARARGVWELKGLPKGLPWKFLLLKAMFLLEVEAIYGTTIWGWSYYKPFMKKWDCWRFLKMCWIVLLFHWWFLTDCCDGSLFLKPCWWKSCDPALVVGYQAGRTLKVARFNITPQIFLAFKTRLRMFNAGACSQLQVVHVHAFPNNPNILRAYQAICGKWLKLTKAAHQKLTSAIPLIQGWRTIHIT